MGRSFCLCSTYIDGLAIQYLIAPPKGAGQTLTFRAPYRLCHDVVSAAFLGCADIMRCRLRVILVRILMGFAKNSMLELLDPPCCGRFARPLSSSTNSTATTSKPNSNLDKRLSTPRTVCDEIVDFVRPCLRKKLRTHWKTRMSQKERAEFPLTKMRARIRRRVFRRRADRNGRMGLFHHAVAGEVVHLVPGWRADERSLCMRSAAQEFLGLKKISDAHHVVDTARR